MDHLVNLESTVLGFCIKEHDIDCLCQKKLQKIERASGKVICEREISEKKGFAKKLLADEQYIFISDFCNLYVLKANDYEIVGKWKIGEDLSSDICGIAVDETKIFCSIRNGGLITFDKDSFEKKDYSVSASSMWSLNIYGDYLLCGTVDGQMLFLDKETMLIRKKLLLSKQNIRSLFIDGEILYAASQDKRLFRIDLQKFEILNVQKNVHKKMFDCAGVYREFLVTVSHPSSEIALWNKDTLEKNKTINVPLSLSGDTYIDQNKLYITSRNIQGIGLIDLDK